MIPPDYTSDTSSINDLISAMNQSIVELQDLIGDYNNSVDLMDINNSLTSLQDHINNMNSPKLITTRVYTLETYYSNIKMYI
jgi:hypothetical protein